MKRAAILQASQWLRELSVKGILQSLSAVSETGLIIMAGLLLLAVIVFHLLISVIGIYHLVGGWM